MADAGGAVPLGGLDILKPWRNCVSMYRAMLAAAPKENHDPEKS
jgi:hypothetical protein